MNEGAKLKFYYFHCQGIHSDILSILVRGDKTNMQHVVRSRMFKLTCKDANLESSRDTIHITFDGASSIIPIKLRK